MGSSPGKQAREAGRGAGDQPQGTSPREPGAVLVHPSPCPHPHPLRLSCTAARFASWSPRSGDAIGRGQPHRCSPSSPRNARYKPRAAEGAEPVGAVIRRPARHRLAFCRLGEGTSLGPAQGVRVRRSRITARSAPFCSGAPGLNHGPSRSQSGPRLSRHSISHGAAFPRNAPRPRRRFVHRASPSRNGRPAHRHQRRGWNACRCSLSPEGRALSRKPIPPPHAARRRYGRGPNPGGAPEFSTE
jgi:hypothetical protein